MPIASPWHPPTLDGSALNSFSLPPRLLSPKPSRPQHFVFIPSSCSFPSFIRCWAFTASPLCLLLCPTKTSGITLPLERHLMKTWSTSYSQNYENSHTHIEFVRTPQLHDPLAAKDPTRPIGNTLKSKYGGRVMDLTTFVSISASRCNVRKTTLF